MIRQATADDLPLVRDLWDEFGSEIHDAPWRDPDHDDDFARIEKALADGGVLLADDDGIAVVSTIGSKTAELDLLHVRPHARGKGLAAELMREAVDLVLKRGLEMLELRVLASNTDARAVYQRWGFEPVELVVAARLDELAQRLVPADGPTFGFVHVQTDDVEKVKRDAAKYLRLEPDVEVEGNWVRVRSDATDEDPDLLKRLAKELSYTTGGVTLSLGVQRGAVAAPTSTSTCPFPGTSDRCRRATSTRLAPTRRLSGG